jgi:outer membrane receptor protein involved in Fe transport
MRRFLLVCFFIAPMMLGAARSVEAQGVTTAAISGTVTRADGGALAGATVRAVHEPSGTTYGSITRSDGRYFIPGMRVGGPYQVTASFLGHETHVRENVSLNLGVTSDIDFNLSEAAIAIEGVTVTGRADAVFSSDRTGAATSVEREVVASMPTITGELESIARLTPQYSGAGFGFSFAGQDNRLNNMTVDGSYFNNSFGLAGQPGDRTGVAPISLEAVEQVQVNIAPFDVRQGNFVGAGVNTVTRSGTNEFSGSVYYRFRDEGLVGKDAGDSPFDPGTFDYGQVGGWLAGPIIANKLFFFVNYENESLTEPGTTFRANTGGEPVDGSVTRVQASDLNTLSEYLSTNFGYDTGPFQGYQHETPATRFLSKLDYNVNDRNKLSLRYNHLDSRTDNLASNSSSLGAGSRRTNSNALNFQNSNYQIKENIRSVVGEWNSIVGENMANNLILGYTWHDESRASRGDFFPMVDILDGGRTYTTFGFEPFTPSNELRYGSYQLQNNFSIFRAGHTFTFGVSAERYESENVFFPGSQSAYVYSSLDDFYTDANDYLANPNRTTSPVQLELFQVRWSNIPGQDKPVQPLEVFYTGIYGQDEWQVNDDLRVTLGARIDAPFFGNTAFENAEVDGMTFRDEDNNAVRYSTSKLPDANLLFSPRIGFNWDARGDRTTQIRGGTGIFTGRPAYVWVSNQIGENGVLTGFEQIRNTNARPFHPDPNHYKPASVSGDPAASYGLAFTDPEFRFPQLWRTNFAVDQRLPFGLIGTGEFLYSKDVNGIYYINANLTEPNGNFTGVDDRPRWTGGTRINGNVTSAIVLKNQDEGYSWNVSGTLERPFSNGLFAKVGYNYGVAKNTVSPGSIASGSWFNNPHAGDPNNPGLGFSSTSPGHRLFGAVSYRAEYFDFGATTISLFGDAFTAGNASYVFSGDLNGDGGRFNDLIYIHNDVSEMNFEPYVVNGRLFTAAEQAAAWDAFIESSDYLREHRGEYAERRAAFLPMVFRADLSLAQDVFRNVAGRRNGLQLRMDVLNVGNLLNNDWGVGKRFTTTSPLIARPSIDGTTRYRLQNRGGELISETIDSTGGIGDVYRIQFSLRYTFN